MSTQKNAKAPSDDSRIESPLQELAKQLQAALSETDFSEEKAGHHLEMILRACEERHLSINEVGLFYEAGNLSLAHEMIRHVPDSLHQILGASGQKVTEEQIIVLFKRLQSFGYDFSIPSHSALGGSVLTFAAMEGHAKIVEFLLPFVSSSINEQNRYGSSALHYASYKGYVDVVKLLINVTGINVNLKDKTDSTPLHDAVSSEHLEVVKRLIEAGADLSATDKQGFTPLRCAYVRGDEEVIQCLQNMELAQKEKKALEAVAPLKLLDQASDGKMIGRKIL